MGLERSFAAKADWSSSGRFVAMTATGCTFGQGTDAQSIWFVWPCHERKGSASTSETDTGASSAEQRRTSRLTTIRLSLKDYAEGNEPGAMTSSAPFADPATRGSEGS